MRLYFRSCCTFLGSGEDSLWTIFVPEQSPPTGVQIGAAPGASAGKDMDAANGTGLNADTPGNVLRTIRLRRTTCSTSTVLRPHGSQNSPCTPSQS